MFDFVTSPEFALIVAILLAIAPVLLNQIRGWLERVRYDKGHLPYKQFNVGRIQRIVRDAHVNIEDDYLRALAYGLAKKRIEKEVYQRIKVRPGNFFAGALLYFAMSIIYLLIALPIPHISETGIGLGRRVLFIFFAVTIFVASIWFLGQGIKGVLRNRTYAYRVGTMSAREDSEFAKDPVRAVLEYGYASEIKPSLDLLLMLQAVRRTNSERRHLSSVREDLVHELETLQSIAGANGSEADSAEAVKRIGYQIATLEAHMSRGTLLPRPAGPTERIFSRLKRRCVRAMKRGQHQ